MKKLYLTILLFVSLGLAACQTPKSTTKKEHISSSSLSEKRNPLSKTTDEKMDSYKRKEYSVQQVDPNQLTETLTDYLSLFIFQDNMIGNLSYNFTEEITEQDFIELKEIIDYYFIPERKKLLQLYKTSRAEFKELDWNPLALDGLIDSLDKIVQQQNRWAEQIINVTPKTAVATKRIIDEESATYVSESTEIGIYLSELLLTSGFSKNETSTITNDALYEAVSLYGDSTDVENSDDFKDSRDEEDLEELLEQLEEMVDELSDDAKGI